MKQQVEIDTETERIYKIEDVESLIADLEQARKELDNKAQQLHNKKITERKIYTEVKKLHGVIPFNSDGSINAMQLPRIIANLQRDPNLLKSFEGIKNFIEEFEKNNLLLK